MILINRRAIAWFLGLTFLFDWGLVGIYRLAGLPWEQPWATVVLSLYMFGPALAAIIVQRRILNEALREPLAIRFRPNRLWLLAWLGPLAFALATLGLGLLWPDTSFDPTLEAFFARLASFLGPEAIETMRAQMAALPIHPFYLTLLNALVTGATINTLFAFGEELGWRGFLHRELRPLGFWRNALVVGFVWGIWHAPIILLGHNYPDHPQLGVLMMTVWCLLLAPPFAWIREKTDSTIAAALMHGMLNATAGLPLMLTAGGNDLTIGVTGLAGFAALALVNLAIYLQGPPEPS